MPEQLRILEGATFCICDEVGDLHGAVEGLFSDDTRFLSCLKLTVNGKRPLLLSSDKIEYFSAAFFMRNPLTEGLEQDVLSIRRERFVGDGMQDTIVLVNESMRRLELEVGLEVGADFADIIAVKVAPLVADAEGRAFEDAQLLIHQLSLRSMRPPEDCASALTTSSSTLTCGGRVTAKRTHSAMSSGRIASTPS